MGPKRSSWGKLAGRRLVGVLVATTALWLAGICIAEQVVQAADATGTTVAAKDQAVQRGLAFLAGRQHDDGSYGDGPYRGNVAVTSFVGRAMMAAGSKPGAGQYGERLSKSVDYLLRLAQPSGMIASKEPRENGPMYGHAFALGFLADCQQASPRPEVRQTMAKAVELIVKSQNREGGWRYRPEPLDADLSVTVTQLSALLAARAAGINVPEATIRQAVDYVKKSQNADGGFRYLIQGGTSGFARSAAAVAVLFRAGVQDGPEVRKGLDYLLKFPPSAGIGQPELFYFYGHYYAAHAISHAGPQAWDRWYPAVRDGLLGQQIQDGSWPDAASVDLGTAMVCLTLQTRCPAPAGK
jgi:squalene cyclase